MWSPGIVLPIEQFDTGIVDQIIDTLTTAQVVGLTAWAEGRERFVNGVGWESTPLDAMRDILHVIDSRVQRGVGDHRAVCLSTDLFSCWASSDPPSHHLATINAAQLVLAGERLDHRLFACLRDAELLMGGYILWEVALPPDTCHYYAEWLPVPAWAEGLEPQAERFGRRFFAGIPLTPAVSTAPVLDTPAPATPSDLPPA